MKSFDWQYLLLGVAPWSSLLELGLRVLAVYVVLVVAVRFLGKRQSGQISNQELAVMLTLGAIVAVAIHDPLRGVLPGLALLVCLLGLHRGVSALAASHPALERATQGGASLLVADGVLALERLRDARISVEQLFTVLRSQGLTQLGQARRVYLEAYGCFSVFRQEPARAGLSLSPSWDAGQANGMKKADGVWACSSCGTLGSAPDSSAATCPKCHTRAWVPAIAGT